MLDWLLWVLAAWSLISTLLVICLIVRGRSRSRSPQTAEASPTPTMSDPTETLASPLKEQSEEQPASDPPHAEHLHMIRSPDNRQADETFALESSRYLLGRDRDQCQIHLDYPAVSSRHAELLHEDGSWFLVDLHSHNHTYVNHREVDPTQRVPLRHNDRIRICDFLFKFVDPNHVDENPPSDSGMRVILERLAAGSGTGYPYDNHPHAVVIDLGPARSSPLRTELVLTRITESAFAFVHQADRCVIIEWEASSEGFHVRSHHTRQARQPNEDFDPTIARRCLETQKAFLHEATGSDSGSDQSVLCVPIIGWTGVLWGVIQLECVASRKFTPEDVRIMWAIANLASVMLENVLLHAELLSSRNRSNG